MVYTEEIELQTKGFTDIINITETVTKAVGRSGLRRGIVAVFCTGTTGAITIIEDEPGVVNDLKRTVEKLAPSNGHYEHDVNGDDGNGFSHVRAALMKPSITVPICEGKMTLGRWQEIVFIDFDNRPRQRKVIIQIVGEK